MWGALHPSSQPRLGFQPQKSFSITLITFAELGVFSSAPTALCVFPTWSLWWTLCRLDPKPFQLSLSLVYSFIENTPSHLPCTWKLQDISGQCWISIGPLGFLESFSFHGPRTAPFFFRRGCSGWICHLGTWSERPRESEPSTLALWGRWATSNTPLPDCLRGWGVVNPYLWINQPLLMNKVIVGLSLVLSRIVTKAVAPESYPCRVLKWKPTALI